MWPVPLPIQAMWQFKQLDLAEYLQALDDDLIYLARYGRQSLKEMRQTSRRYIRRYVKALDRLLKRESPDESLSE